MVIEVDGKWVDVPARLEVRGSGTPGTPVPEITSVDSITDDADTTTVVAGPVTLRLARRIGTSLPGAATLTGSVEGEEVVLASVE